MLQALLLAIWAGLCTWDQFGPHLGFRKPLLASSASASSSAT